jgi:hypothetical protein
LRVIEELEAPQLHDHTIKPLSQFKTSFAEDERWQAVRRVVASSSFAKSSRLSTFLLYVCEKTLLDCTDEITEQQIGVNVFGRSADYNPGDDNIVRGVARQLRQRLALYYQEEGPQDPWRISIPRGGYVAVFEPHGISIVEPEEHPNPPSLPVEDEIAAAGATGGVPIAARAWKPYALTFLAFGLGIVAVLMWQHLITHKGPETPTSPLWHALFTPNRRTVIVAGDAGLNMFNNLARRRVSASEYRTRSYLNSPFAETPSGYTWTPFVKRDYTSFPDLLLVSKIVRRPEVIPDRLDVRFARSVSIEDLKEPNVILIGSENYDPWVSMFDSDLNFALVWHGDTNTTEITNAAPLPGEKSSYHPGLEEGSDHRVGYALVDFINRKDHGNKILMIQGASMLGIDAAIDFLVQETELGAVLKNARSDNGNLKSFEVLLQSDFVNGNTQNTHVIATRFHP